MQHDTSRTKVRLDEKWNLKDIYSSVEEWKEDVKKIKIGIEFLKILGEKINDPKNLYHFLLKNEELHKTFILLSSYARLNNDIDTQNTDAQDLLFQIETLRNSYNEATSLLVPFIQKTDTSTLNKYIDEVPSLGYFRNTLFEMQRYKEHTLSSEKEKLLAQIDYTFTTPTIIFNMMNTDITFGEILNEDNTKESLTRGIYHQILRKGTRERRKEACEAFFKPFIEQRNTFAASLTASIKNNVTLAQLRNYPSALEKSLFPDKIKKNFYLDLINTTKNNLNGFHSYGHIRKGLLGYKELFLYDTSADIVPAISINYSFNDAYSLMSAALNPLGKEYSETVFSYKQSRYIDVRETPGKFPGAYTLDVYGVHPYILLNYTDDIKGLFTLTHEMGHALHSHYSSIHQSFPTSVPSKFVTEVAAIVNEILLAKHLINNAKSLDEQKYFLNIFIEKFAQTFFTQVMFAEYEMKIHERVEQNKSLNYEFLNNLYCSLFLEYYGDAYSLTEQVGYSWAMMGHFYHHFYVYKYASGFAAAINIAHAILHDPDKYKDKYLDFLKGGSSKSPLEVVKITGVDFDTHQPIEHTLAIFESLVNEFRGLNLVTI